jgi:hypothetical protein
MSSCVLYFYIFDQQKNQLVEFNHVIPTLFRNNIGKHKINNQPSAAYVLFYRRDLKSKIVSPQCSANKAKQYLPAISVKIIYSSKSLFALDESVQKKSNKRYSIF